MFRLRSKKLKFAGAITLLLVAVFSGLLLLNEISETGAAIFSARARIAELERKENELSLAEDTLKNLNDEIKVIEGVFVKEENFAGFVELLESLAHGVKSSFRAESASLPQESGFPARIGFEIEGSFFAITSFITLLDRLPVAGFVESMRIVPDEANVRLGAPRLKARFDYMLFSFQR